MPVEINAMEDNLDGSSLEEDVLKSESDNSEEYDDLPDDDEFSDDDEKNNVFEKLQSIESKKRKQKMEKRSIQNILDESQRSRKRKKKGHASILPPTAEEMTRLRESENLFHSNLFRLQIEEMIKEVKPKQSERKTIKQWLEKFVKFLMNVNESTLLTVESLEDYQVPFCELPKKLKVDLDFLKPASVDVQGSYKAGCCLGPSLVVDVFVTMPRQCFSKTDRFNGLYHFKRAMYLAYLTKLLDGNELLDNDKGLEYCNKFGDPLKSVLLIHPMGRLRRVGVFLHVIPEEGSFKLINLSPDKNNVKTSWWIENSEPAVATPTPHYNNSILEDMVVSKNETLRSEILEGNQNLKDAITLLRVWLRQRQLDKGYGSFDGYITCMLVISLFRSRKLNSFMSSYQIVRNVWITLAQTDWSKKGISLCINSDDVKENLEIFHKHFEVVFLDVTGYCNLTARMSKLTYMQVKQESSLALQCLDNPHMNSFHALFITPMPFIRQYDHIIRIKKLKTIQEISKNSSMENQLDLLGNTTLLATQVVQKLLEHGIGHRLSTLTTKLEPPVCWSVKHTFNNINSITLGMRLNVDTALSVIDKGPEANLPEATEFRKFWGDKSELRRFKDGTVCEAIVWANSEVSIARRRLIVKDIVLFLLMKKLHLKESSVIYLADQLDELIKEKSLIPDGFEYGTGEEAARQIIESYNRLASQIRDLSLPLDISSVQCTSPVFWFCSLFPPLACEKDNRFNDTILTERDKPCLMLKEKLFKAPKYIPPIEVIIKLGLTRNWPEDIEAIRRVKAAFNIQIGKELSEKLNLETQVFPNYVDVAKDGFVFRVSVAYEREVLLLKEIKTPDGKKMYRDTTESIKLEKSTVILPKLSGALSGLSQQCIGYGPATCLAKRWLNAQLFNGSLFPDIVADLLMAYIFLLPEPYRVLIQPQAAFLHFLNLLANTNFHLEPIIVSFNNDLKREDILEIETYFRNERSTIPPLFIATQYDKTGSVWTKQAPLLPVLAWLAKVAAESLRNLESEFFFSGRSLDCMVIFRPPLHIFDVYIWLRPLMCPQRTYKVDFNNEKTPKSIKAPKDKFKIPIVDFDPVQKYISELRDHYGEFALFFHDTYGGNVIGVLLKPSALEKHEFKVSQINCRKPIVEGDSTYLALNMEALMADFYILGKGLVQVVKLNTKHELRWPI